MEEISDTKQRAKITVKIVNRIPNPSTTRPSPKLTNVWARPSSPVKKPVKNMAIPEITQEMPDTPNANTTEPMVINPAKMIAIAPMARGSAMGDANIPKITSQMMEPKPLVGSEPTSASAPRP